MEKMRILVACERSGIVRNEFAQLGHDAWSCDLVESDLPGQHYKGNVLDILYDKWDMIIAHPPCTYLTKARGVLDLVKMKEAAIFFNKFVDHPCEKVVIENPIPFKKAYSFIPRPNHWVCPSHFGSVYTKFTCLWLKGVAPLMPTLYFPRSHTKSIMTTYRCPIARSNTDVHLAKAMASQWG